MERILRILLVDDDPDARLLLAAVLEAQLGAVVVPVPGIEDAMRSLAARGVDLVVSDGLLGSSTALDLVRAIDLAVPGAGVPVVVVTAAKDEAFSRRLLGAGVRAVLDKPPDPAQLEAAVRAAMAHGA